MGQVATRAFVDLAALGYLNSPTRVDYWFYDRDEFLTDDIYSTDLALNYAFSWRLWNQEMEVFLQPEVLNVFNEDRALFVNSSIRDSRQGLPGFNPFTETPVEGVHFAKGPLFGQPQAEADFQNPRIFRFSVGFRF